MAPCRPRAQRPVREAPSPRLQSTRRAAVRVPHRLLRARAGLGGREERRPRAALEAAQEAAAALVASHAMWARPCHGPCHVANHATLRQATGRTTIDPAVAPRYIRKCVYIYPVLPRPGPRVRPTARLQTAQRRWRRPPRRRRCQRGGGTAEEVRRAKPAQRAQRAQQT